MKPIYRTIQTCIILVTLACPATAGADSDVYVHIDEQGAYHFTDTPTSSEYIQAPTFSAPGVDPKTAGKYEDIIRKSSKKSGIRPELIKAVIRVESGFNPKAVSDRGARGLMQLMPVHTREYNIESPFNPSENIAAGTLYLGRLLERYNGNLNLSLAAYNAGPATVDHYQGIPPYRETRQYVQKVLLYYRHYRNADK
ncbi:MAG: lytic transglycosylase domain-containing protein [Desulfobacteraceae bacterium]|nr:lytic transglycosylase domain-containing protein [Desulfobacteraceae bacterium]MCF8095465.1 lytic transglycosylase domain-containing protein [Desulfobacteraceae bacterium]